MLFMDTCLVLVKKWLTVKCPDEELPFWMSKRFYFVMVFTMLTWPYVMFVRYRCTVVTFKFSKTVRRFPCKSNRRR